MRESERPQLPYDSSDRPVFESFEYCEAVELRRISALRTLPLQRQFVRNHSRVGMDKELNVKVFKMLKDEGEQVGGRGMLLLLR